MENALDMKYKKGNIWNFIQQCSITMPIKIFLKKWMKDVGDIIKWKDVLKNPFYLPLTWMMKINLFTHDIN